MQNIDPKTVINILVVDDHTLFREGLRRILEFEKDIKIVGEAKDSAEALRLTGKSRPDVILMDINLPGLNGIKTTRQIKKKYKWVHIIMLSMYEDTEHIMESFQAGASGYIIKTRPSSELVEAIRCVSREGVSISPTVEHKLLKGIREPSLLSGAKRPILTKTEVRVLKLVAAGRTNKEIASKLFVSEKTVKNHLNHIYRKLGVKNRPQAVLEGLKRNYISGHQ